MNNILRSQFERSEAKSASQPLRIISVLAEGHSNLVVLVQNNETPDFSVAKILTEDRRDLLAKLEAEADIHKDLEHPKILKSVGFREDIVLIDPEGNEIVATGILMEHAPRGALFDLLSCFNQMPLLLARSYARQMVEAIAYLHERGIAHRDIKPENFLLDSNFNIKLADFGFSCKTNREEKLSELIGTPEYWAPEQQEQNPYNGFEIDVFSLGLTLFVLLAGRMPFGKVSKEDEYYVNFINEEEGKFWQMHEDEINPSSSRSFFRDDFKELINGMLCYKASERMTMKEVLNHPWLNVPLEIADKCGGIVNEFLKKKAVVN